MLIRTPRITAAGLSLFANQAPGFSAAITHIALGSGIYDPTGVEVALKSEFSRFPILSGTNISPSQIQIGALVKDSDPQGRSPNNKYVGELGFYVGATLFAVLSQGGSALFYKSPQLDVPISYVLDFSTLPPGSLSVSAPSMTDSLTLASQTANAAALAAASALATIKASHYGATGVAPITRPDGTPMQKGDRYFDTLALLEKTYNGQIWYIPNIDTAALAAAGGAALIGNNGESVANSLDSLQLSDYDALRNYVGSRKCVYITGYMAEAAPTGIAGMFIRVANDQSSGDNGGTIIVSKDGTRWKRAFDGYIYDRWFGARSGTDATAPIQAAVNYGVATNTGVKVTVNAAVTKIVVQNAAYNFTLIGENAILTGISDTAQDGILEIVNCVSQPVKGFHLSAANNINYRSALRVRVRTGTSQSVTRVSFEDITVMNAQCAYWVGTRDIDYQCSEITFTACHAFHCPQYLYGAGSQGGAIFMGCNMVSEPNSAFPSVPLRMAFLEGGFWYTDGSELIQTDGGPGSVLVEARPAVSAMYHNPYPKWSSTGGHVESAGLLVYVNNLGGLAKPRSSASSFVFSNLGGYTSSNGPRMIDTTGDNSYAGKIVLDSTVDFYGDVDANGDSIQRRTDHIVLGENTRIDMDGTPFGQSFKQGLSAIHMSYRGKPRLRGETILSRYGSKTKIFSSPEGTKVAFPATVPTINTVYGDATFNGVDYVADQDLMDVVIEYQLYFDSEVPIADAWVAVSDISTGCFAYKVSDSARGGSMSIPSVLKGQTISIFAKTNSGSAVSLSGGLANFFKIRARTLG